MGENIPLYQDTYKLWVDDAHPQPNYISNWRSVQSFKEFKKIIEILGLPYYISFARDLEKECTKWLIDNGYKIPKYDIREESDSGRLFAPNKNF